MRCQKCSTFENVEEASLFQSIYVSLCKDCINDSNEYFLNHSIMDLVKESDAMEMCVENSVDVSLEDCTLVQEKKHDLNLQMFKLAKEWLRESN